MKTISFIEKLPLRPYLLCSKPVKPGHYYVDCYRGALCPRMSIEIRSVEKRMDRILTDISAGKRRNIDELSVMCRERLGVLFLYRPMLYRSIRRQSWRYNIVHVIPNYRPSSDRGAADISTVCRPSYRPSIYRHHRSGPPLRHKIHTFYHYIFWNLS